MEPSVSPILLITLRSFACFIILTPIGYYQAKKSFKDSLIEPFYLHSYFTFAMVFSHYMWVILVIFVGLSVLPIVNVSVCLNLGPLLAVILAVPILGEKLLRINLLITIGLFFGVILIVFGT